MLIDERQDTYNSIGRIFNGAKAISAKNWVLPEDASCLFNGDSNQTSTIETIDVTGWDLTNTKYLNDLFSYHTNLKNIIGLDTWDTSNIKSMDTMFEYNSSLTEIDISSFAATNLEDVSNMFSDCTNLEEVNFSTSGNKITNVEAMFYNTPNLRKVNLSGLNMVNAEGMVFSYSSTISTN